VELASLKELKPIFSARHNGKDAPSGCLKDTRIDVLEELELWARQLSPHEFIYWMSGLAGTGKSALMRSICDRLAELSILGASFFISRTDKERQDPGNVVRTIAYHFARLQSIARVPIAEAIQRNPDVVQDSLMDQIHCLLEIPLSVIARQLESPIIIVIDGLDECAKDINGLEGGDLLLGLFNALEKCSGKIKLIISSRLERTIQNVFAVIRPAWFKLHNIEESVVRADIRLFFEVSFLSIAREHALDRREWPAERSLDELTNRAGGLFIYAATVVKFLSTSRADPIARLRSILDGELVSGSSSYRQLDGIYNHILQSAIPTDLEPHEKEELIQRLRTLLGVLVVLQRPLSVAELATLLKVEDRSLRNDLNSISAVVLLPDDESNGVVQLFHASFPDYLANPSRCTEFDGHLSIQPSESHGHVVFRAVSVMSQPTSILNANSGVMRYYQKFWRYHHARASGETREKAIELFRKQVQQHFPNDSDYQDMSSRLQTALQVAYESDGDPSKLQEWVSLARKSLTHDKEDDSPRLGRITHLANGLWAEYQRSGDTSILNEATSLYREVLRLAPPEHRGRQYFLNNLAAALHVRCWRPGDVTVLDEVITLYQESLSLRPIGHRLRDVALNNLAAALQTRYNETGDKADLNEAIVLYNESLSLRPLGHPDRNSSLYNLGLCHRLLYDMRQEQAELENAIQFFRESLSLRSPREPKRHRNAGSLSGALVELHELSKARDSLEEAVSLARESLSLCPEGHIDRDYALSTLICALEHIVEEGDDAEVAEELKQLRDEKKSL
jgi:hypothetical protein